jgi:hypothetical protein
VTGKGASVGPMMPFDTPGGVFNIPPAFNPFFTRRAAAVFPSKETHSFKIFTHAERRPVSKRRRECIYASACMLSYCIGRRLINASCCPLLMKADAARKI